MTYASRIVVHAGTARANSAPRTAIVDAIVDRDAPKSVSAARTVVRVEEEAILADTIVIAADQKALAVKQKVVFGAQNVLSVSSVRWTRCSREGPPAKRVGTKPGAASDHVAGDTMEISMGVGNRGAEGGCQILLGGETGRPR
jgi:hypothetical protein